MKKKLLASVLAGVIGSLAILSLVGCEYFVKKDGYYEHPDYVAVYTPEENKQRIEMRTAEKFSNEIASGEIVSYKVEILHAFYDDDPEYFMVELEYAEEFESEYENIIPTGSGNTKETITYKTKWKYIIGYIQGRSYQIGLPRYPNYANGRNPYDYLGYLNSKKYYGGGQFAVEKEEGKLAIYFGSGSSVPPIDSIIDVENHKWRFEQYYIDTKREKQLMESNFIVGSSIYMEDY